MAVRRVCSKLTALDFRRAHFGLFMNLLGIEPWKAEGHKNVDWYYLLQAQEQCIPMRRKLGKNVRRPPRMNKELRSKLRAKKEKISEGRNDNRWPGRDTGKLYKMLRIRLRKPKPR